ncbi:ankyrin repeat and zinc finger domain-containing protein 1 isoform X1 [Varanus komodoensis]|uniref:ankyrin repeat and zinc finger domain-containing protein 1 isoform X1 n=2 Tax=Varanus komodoensis TaxID=61221 RepID=UPI001CF776B0|nr:ankyrin repeat and zinc finger domain-containing protein 1 isoform X1 [Varanus komodoensis]XP_044294276.1 ankyrin repeat and zinc finger domain-containing protein 1 isoform X1 [Varanus komodoensis]XP_044294277.1 ankyrin repeat and zinc finger domain-containing protein 1 isoform X1 [Varanus komodoensis]
MQPTETCSVFEATQNTALMDGLCLVLESTGDVTTMTVPGTKRPDQASVVLEVSDRMHCSTCSKPFESREEQTEHYKLDWHRFNLKQRLLGHQMLTAEEFEMKTQAGDVSSISGSDSSNSDLDSESESSSYQNSEDKGSSHQSPSPHPRSQRVLFRNSQGQLISVYRCVLNTMKGSTEESADLVTSLQKQSPKTSWVILMAGGGHFAGAIFKGNEVLKHKTFHRYTVRARRGTAQGVREVQGSMPKSAGASLRRYNEFALLKDIQELLASWAGDLQEAECIFVRAPGSNRARFFGSKNGPLQRDDPRVRGIPFSTRRATFREVQRVHATLSNLQVYGRDTAVADLISSPRKSWKKVVHRNEASSQLQDTVFPARSEEEEEGEEESLKQLELVEATLSTLELREFEVAPKRNRKKKRKKAKAEAESHSESLAAVQEPKPFLSRQEKSTEDQKHLEPQGRPDIPVQDALFTACKIGDMTTLQHLLGVADSTADEGVECNALASHELLNMPLDESGWTLLHVAAAAGRSAVVRLLLETGADPALRDRQEQPPYCVSATKQTRNEFRRFMAEHPVKYDYVQAQVPGPLTAEMETRQTERRRAHKAQRKQREKEEREVQQLLEKEEEEKRRFALLSDREKRALAAERRLAVQLKDSGAPLTNTRRCWLCGESLLGRIPFHYLDFSFCSTSCLRAHRERKATPS